MEYEVEGMAKGPCSCGLKCTNLQYSIHTKMWIYKSLLVNKS